MQEFKYYADDTNVAFAVLIENTDFNDFGFNAQENQFRMITAFKNFRFQYFYKIFHF